MRFICLTIVAPVCLLLAAGSLHDRWKNRAAPGLRIDRSILNGAGRSHNILMSMTWSKRCVPLRIEIYTDIHRASKYYHRHLPSHKWHNIILVALNLPPHVALLSYRPLGCLEDAAYFPVLCNCHYRDRHRFSRFP